MLQHLDRHRAGTLAIFIGAIFWSSGGLFIKLLPFDPYTILFYRAACACILFSVSFGKKVFRLDGLTLLVAIFYTGLAMSFVIATKMTTAANAVFLQYTAPIYVLLLEPYLFKFRLSRLNIITVIVCAMGMLLFFWGDLGGGDLVGNLIGLSSGIFLSGMMLTQRFNAPDRHEAGIFWGNLLIVLISCPWFLQSATPSTTQLGMLLFLGFVQIGFGYMLFTYGLKRVTAVEAVLIATLEPVLNPVWVYFGYGEKPTLMALLGGLIILTMLTIQVILSPKTRTPQID